MRFLNPDSLVYIFANLTKKTGQKKFSSNVHGGGAAEG